MRVNSRQHPHASLTKLACHADTLIKIAHGSVRKIELSKEKPFQSAVMPTKSYAHVEMSINDDGSKYALHIPPEHGAVAMTTGVSRARTRRVAKIFIAGFARGRHTSLYSFSRRLDRWICCGRGKLILGVSTVPSNLVSRSLVEAEKSFAGIILEGRMVIISKVPIVDKIQKNRPHLAEFKTENRKPVAVTYCKAHKYKRKIRGAATLRFDRQLTCAEGTDSFNLTWTSVEAGRISILSPLSG